MLRRTAFARPRYVPLVQAPPTPVERSGVLARCDDAATPRPKSVPKRNPTLLAMARDRPCLLLVPGCCNYRVDTTVAAHSGLSIHGKAGARKADDPYSVHACAACHSWLDQGKATFLQKEAAFMAAHLRQVLVWREIAADSTEPERFRKAAQWALDQLDAAPACSSKR